MNRILKQVIKWVRANLNYYVVLLYRIKILSLLTPGASPQGSRLINIALGFRPLRFDFLKVKNND